MMIIKDELYGMVGFDDLERRIIDTPDFQRLRRIKQMSFTNLVYPGANHTRFEHSLGTAHLSSVIAKRLGLDADACRKVKLYGLLHDVGHTAFSHEGEDVLAPLIGDHEKLGEGRMRSGPLADVLRENYRPEEIIGLGKSREGQIVSSDIGSDRMDYLKRDALNTGVAYGVIDIDRIVHTLAFAGEELAIGEGGLEAAESLLIARFMMFSAVYLHHTVRIATAMLAKAISLSLEDGAVGAGDFRELTDDDAIAAMSRSTQAKPYIDGLLGRKLYKEVFSFPGGGSGKGTERAAKGLGEKLGCEIILDRPSRFSKAIGFRVRTGSGLRPITELSGLVFSLAKAEESRMRTLVLAPAEKREEAEKLAPKLFA
jgi:HD superfamily phosphohydrolase